MQYVPLGATGPAASALAFGCAPIMGFHDRRASLRGLHAAREQGITLFDVARSYGYGQAEALVGEFARGRRAELVIMSKFGIRPDPSLRGNAIRLLRGGVRGIRHLTVGRGPGNPVDAFSPHWSPDALRTSLHRSLRELGTDYVDLFLLHSPPGAITKRDDLFAELDRLQQQGLLRGYGLSTDTHRASEALAFARHRIGTVQHPYCPLTGTTEVLAFPPRVVILNHVFGGRGTLRNADAPIAALRERRDLPASTRDVLASAPPAAILSDLLINGARLMAGAQCVVVSMFTPEHIAQNAAVAGNSRFTDAELRALMTHLAHAASPRGASFHAST